MGVPPAAETRTSAEDADGAKIIESSRAQLAPRGSKASQMIKGARPTTDDFLQLALGEESDPPAVRRKERLIGALRAREGCEEA